MFTMTDRRNKTMEFCEELCNLNRTILLQQRFIDELQLQSAMYKAYFFRRSNLAEKFRKQITENDYSRTGEFDGFCYASWRAKAVYRTLEDMLREGLITQEEYAFCEV